MIRNCFISSDSACFLDANLVKLDPTRRLHSAQFSNASLNCITILREVALFSKTVGVERKISVGLTTIDNQGNGSLFLFHNYSSNTSPENISYRQIAIQLTVDEQGKGKSKKALSERKIYLVDGPMAVICGDDGNVIVHCLAAVKAGGSVPYVTLGKLPDLQAIENIQYNNEHYMALRLQGEWKWYNAMCLYRHFVADESLPELIKMPCIPELLQDDSDHLASIPGASRVVTASISGCITVYASDMSVLHMLELPLPPTSQVHKVIAVGRYPRVSIIVLCNSNSSGDIEGDKPVLPFALLFDAETMKLQQEVRGVLSVYCDRFLNDLEFHLLWMTALDTTGVLSLLPTEKGLVFFRADGTERCYPPQNVVNTATINSGGKKKINDTVVATKTKKGTKKAKVTVKEDKEVSPVSIVVGTIKTKKKMRKMDGLPKASALVSEQTSSESNAKKGSPLSKEVIEKEIAARDEAMKVAMGGEYGMGTWQSREGKGPPRSILLSLQEQIKATAQRLALFQHDYRVKRTEIAALRGMLVQQLCNPASFAPDTLPISPFTRFFDQWRRRLQHATSISQQREYLVSEVYPLSHIPVGADTMQVMRESVMRAAQQHARAGSCPPAQILETHIPPYALRYSHAANSEFVTPNPSDSRDVSVLETLCLPDIDSASFGVTLLLRVQNHSPLPVFDMRITCSLDNNGLPTPQLGKADAPPGTPNISKTIPVSLLCTSAVVPMTDVREEVWMTARVPLSPNLFTHRSIATHKAYDGGQHRYPRNPMGIADITRSYMQDKRQAADTAQGIATAVSMDDNPYSVPFEGLLLRVGLVWKDVRGAVQVSSSTNTSTAYADKCQDIRLKLNRNRVRSCWEVRHGYFPSTSRGILAAVAVVNLEDMYLVRRPPVSVREEAQERVKRASLVRCLGAFRVADMPSQYSDPGQWLRAALIHWTRSAYNDTDSSHVRLVSYLTSQEVEVVSARDSESVFHASNLLNESAPIAVHLNEWRAAGTSGAVSDLLEERMKGMPELGGYLSDRGGSNSTKRHTAVNLLLFESRSDEEEGDSNEIERVERSRKVTGRLISAPAPVSCPGQVGTDPTSLGTTLAYLNSHILRPHNSFAVPIYDKDASLDAIKTAATFLLEEMKAISVAYRLQKQKINQHHSMLGTASLSVEQLKAKCGHLRSAGKKLFLVDEAFWRELAEREVKADVAVAGAFEMTKYL